MHIVKRGRIALPGKNKPATLNAEPDALYPVHRPGPGRQWRLLTQQLARQHYLAGTQDRFTIPTPDRGRVGDKRADDNGRKEQNSPEARHQRMRSSSHR